VVISTDLLLSLLYYTTMRWK